MLTLLLPAAALLGWPDLRAHHRLLPRREVSLPHRNPVSSLRIGAVPAAALLGLLLAGVGGLLAASALTALGVWWWRTRGGYRLRLQRSAALAAGFRLLVAELRAGSHPAAAAEGAAVDADPPVAAVFRDLSTTARMGGDVASVLTAAGAGAEAVDRRVFRFGERAAPVDPLARAGRAWALAERHGVALAELLDAVRRDLEHRVAFAREVEAKLAGPRATAAVLAGLPLLGLLLGEVSGATPLAVLTGGLFGQAVLVLGVALLCAGVLWTVRLTESVVRT